jgi:uncharacterized protein YceK
VGAGGAVIPCLWSRASTGLWGGAWNASSAVLLVNHDVEKPSTSYGFRVLKFQLSLVLYLSQCVSNISAKSLVHGAHVVCGCVLVTILDLPLSEILDKLFYGISKKL